MFLMDITRLGTSPQRTRVSALMDLKRYLEIQTREIERHKWIESEKAGKDLGLDAAIDWIMRYADVFSDGYCVDKDSAQEPAVESSRG